MSDVHSELPDPHIYGDVVLQRVFDRPPGDLVQIYSRTRGGIDDLKGRLSIKTNVQVVVAETRSLIMNCDYWLLTEFAGPVWSMSTKWPVTRTLVVPSDVSQSDAEGIVHTVHTLISWPWLEIDANIPQLLGLLQESIANDTESIEVQALDYGYNSALDLLARVEERFHGK